MTEFCVAKATKVAGKGLRWNLLIKRPFVSATVWDNVAPELEFITAQAALDYGMTRYDVGNFVRSTGRGSAVYRGSNNDAEAMPVIYVKDEHGITAIFPTEHYSNDTNTICYAHIGQHSECSIEWAKSQYNATDAQRRSLEVELQGIYTTRPRGNPETYGKPVSLYVVDTFKPWMANARYDQFHGNRK